ncbi:MAG: hypothetical protein J7497_00420, partial [Chitinophagaceae bacterium]|nr:hypothetical protein [Chitinophagaceae bacterium]
MKHTRHLLLLLLIISLIVSCKKDEFQTTPLSSLIVVNTVTGGSPVRMAGVSTFDIGNNGYGFFSTMIGNPDIYVYPIDDSLNPYYHSNKSVSIKENEYFTLFLCGTPDAPENVLIKESYSFYQDSVTGIRFINLSPNSSPLN